MPIHTRHEKRPPRPWGLVALVALALALPVHAQAPAPPAGSPTDLPAHMAAPTLGEAKDSVKDSVKSGVQGLTGSLPTSLPGMGAGAAPAGAAPGAAPAAPGAPTAVLDPVVATADRLAALRRKVLREEDFAENEETNRDPFHSYMKLFVEGPPTGGPKDGPPAIFDKLALEELTLIAIITGDANPMAMFRDPSGLGKTVQRGDYVSRARGRVTKILSDRVVVELQESTGNGPPKTLEKAILVNPEESGPQ